MHSQNRGAAKAGPKLTIVAEELKALIVNDKARLRITRAEPSKLRPFQACYKAGANASTNCNLFLIKNRARQFRESAANQACFPKGSPLLFNNQLFAKA